MNREAFAAATNELGLSLTHEQLTAFEAFEEALYKANEVMNLTRIPREECWLRHFIDSLLFQDLIPEFSEVLDIGSGPGFPAWPLACARPGIKVTTLDSHGKSIAFLRQNPLPNLTVVNGRAEDWGVTETYDIVTGRALAPLALQLELSAAPCTVGGKIIPMRTPSDRKAIAEIKRASLGIQLKDTVNRTLPGTDIERLFPIYEKIAPTPKRYPRTWAEMKTKPLTQ
ncbi:MAG: 16S rRNA (guanine(527)-N(7))-methyltransferase RsmG [Fimbriimonas sp.]